MDMVFIDGDCATNALFCVAHKVALECDILYTHDDGEGFLFMDQQEFRALDPKRFWERLFKFRLLSPANSPHGFLPPYRYWVQLQTINRRCFQNHGEVEKGRTRECHKGWAGWFPYDNCAGLQPGEGPSQGLFRDCENIADKSFAALLLGHGPARRVAPRAHPARRGR